MLIRTSFKNLLPVQKNNDVPIGSIFPVFVGCAIPIEDESIKTSIECVFLLAEGLRVCPDDVSFGDVRRARSLVFGVSKRG